MGIVGSVNNTTQLNSIEGKIDTILSNISSGGISFTLLNINPTFSTASSGWTVAPTSLTNISDNNVSTFTNLFEIGGASNAYGDIIVTPGITIPQYTRIQSSISFSSNNSGRPLLELAVANSSNGTYSNIWSYYPRNSINTSEIAATIDASAPFSWNSLRFTIWDIGQFGCRCRISDLKVWEMI